MGLMQSSLCDRSSNTRVALNGGYTFSKSDDTINHMVTHDWYVGVSLMIGWQDK